MATPKRGSVAFSTTPGSVPTTGRGEVRFAKAGDQRQPRGHLKSVADELFDQAAGYRSRGRAVVLTARSAIRKDVIEEVALVLGESVHSHLNVVVLHDGYVQARLRAGIIGGLVHGRDHRHIVRRRRYSWPGCSDRRVKPSAAGLD